MYTETPKIRHGNLVVIYMQAVMSKKVFYGWVVFGPVLTSVHSVAVSLMTSLGSSHETPKYIEIDKVWKKIKAFISICVNRKSKIENFLFF